MEWIDTKASAERLKESAISNWQPAITVSNIESPPEIGQVKSIINSTVSIYEGTKSGLETSKNYFTDTAQLEQLGNSIDATVGASLDFLTQKLEELKAAWNSRTTVTVKAIIGEIAPYAAALSQGKSKDLFNTLKVKLTDLTNKLLGEAENQWDQLLDSLGELGQDYIKSVTNDFDVTTAISNLSMVKGIVNTIDTAAQAIDKVASVMKVLEPLMPTLETVASFAASWITGGTSAAEALNKISEEVQRALQEAGKWALNTIKTYLYNIEINVPTIFLSSVKSLSMQKEFSIITDKEDEQYNETLQFLFDSGYTLDIADTSSYQSAIISSLQNLSSDVRNFYNFGLSAEDQKTFIGSLSKNFFTTVVDKARQQIAVDKALTSAKEIFETLYNNSLDNSDNSLEEDAKKSQMLYDDETLRLTTKYIYEAIIE